MKKYGIRGAKNIRLLYCTRRSNVESRAWITGTGVEYTVAGIGIRLRPCTNALCCKACQVQPPQFQTGFSIANSLHISQYPYFFFAIAFKESTERTKQDGRQCHNGTDEGDH